MVFARLTHIPHPSRQDMEMASVGAESANLPNADSASATSAASAMGVLLYTSWCPSTWHQSANGDLENMNLSILGLATTFSLTLLASAAVPAAANAQASATAPGGLPFEVKPVGTFQSPWALAFLPNGNVLVTQ